MKKVFDPDGELTLVFAKDATVQIQKWLGTVDYNDAIKYAEQVKDPVFGLAYKFPCKSVTLNICVAVEPGNTFLAFYNRIVGEHRITPPDLKGYFGIKDDRVYNGDAPWCEVVKPVDAFNLLTI